MLLTRRALYQFNPYDSTLLHKTDLRDIYSLVQTLSDTISIISLRFAFISRKASLEHWGKGDHALSFLHRKDFESESVADCFDFILLANRLRNDRIQLLFEEELSIVPPPEVFKRAFLVTKVNRHHRLQARWFLFSDKRLYNVDVGKRGFDPRATKVWLVLYSMNGK